MVEIYEDTTNEFNKYSPKEEKLRLYMSWFKGREDVYAKRWESRDGKKGYTPVCANEWKQGLCNKKLIKCEKCKHRQLVPLDNKAIEKHLRGMDELGRDVVGLYPLLEDDTCYLLAVDFDKKEWKKDVLAFRLACEEQGLEVAVEKSRSGNGAHVWVFFGTNIPAITARKLGNLLLTNAMNKRHEIGFESYDRLFPNQDTMPKGGFGNLIALPLQGNARKNGNSVFVDCNFTPYEDQWKYLNQLKKLSVQKVEEHIKRLEKLVGTMAESELATEKGEDERKALKTIKLATNDFPKEVKIVKSHMLYIDKVGISARALNQFKRIASFNNPDFFKTQAMRMPTYDKPRFTSFKIAPELVGERYGINTIYKAVCESEVRNGLILGDIVQALEKGRTPIVISERTEHVQYLAEKLNGRCKNVIVLTGTLKARERNEMSAKLQAISEDEELVIVATGKYIGEGFDFPRLDTLFLAMPIVWKGTLAQYAGRLHRNYDSKQDVLVYDYVDIHVGTLEKMYHKRVKGYASIGYTVWDNKTNRNSQNIYESGSFTETFLKDINEADKSILIVSPSLSRTRTMMVKKHLESKCMPGIKLQIITKPIEQYKEISKGAVGKIVNELVQLGCEVVFKEDVYQKFGIIDGRVVWYGNIHLLGYGQESETIMRIDSIEIAEELGQTLE